MKTKMKYLFLAFLSMLVGLGAGYLAKSLAVQLLVQSFALIVLFLFPPFRDELHDNTTPAQVEEIVDENDDKKGCEKENSDANQIALVIAVCVSLVIGFGIYIFTQKIFLAIFIAIILFVLIYKYGGINKYFGELTWPF